MQKSCFTEEIQRATFKMFDANGDGKIDLEELKSMFNSLMVETLDSSAQFTGEISRRTITDEQWRSILDEADKNKDGFIDYDEFSASIRDIAQKVIKPPPAESIIEIEIEMPEKPDTGYMCGAGEMCILF